MIIRILRLISKLLCMVYLLQITPVQACLAPTRIADLTDRISHLEKSFMNPLEARLFVETTWNLENYSKSEEFARNAVPAGPYPLHDGRSPDHSYCAANAPLQVGFREIIEETDEEYPEARDLHNRARISFAGLKFKCTSKEESLSLMSRVILDQFKWGGNDSKNFAAFVMPFWVFLGEIPELKSNIPSVAAIFTLASKMDRSHYDARRFPGQYLRFLNDVQTYSLKNNQPEVLDAALLYFILAGQEFGSVILKQTHSMLPLSESPIYRFLQVKYGLLREWHEGKDAKRHFIVVEQTDYKKVNRWQVALDRLKDLKNDPRVQGKEFSVLFALASLYTGDFQTGVEILETSWDTYGSCEGIFEKNLLTGYALVGRNQEAIAVANGLLRKSDLSPEDLETVERSRRMILHELGDKEALGPLLEKRQEKVLASRRRMVEKIKASLAESAKKKAQESHSPVGQKTKLPHAPSRTVSDADYSEMEVEKSNANKTHKKLRKKHVEVAATAATPAARSVEKKQEPGFSNLKTIEELLSGKKRALEIFYRLFENFRTKIRTQAIDISMDEVEILMDALEQDFDPSAGKGSHTKITFNDSIQPEIPPTFDNAMLILSKRIKLSGAQIESLRNIFLTYYLFPSDLKQVLIDKGLLNLAE